MQQRIARPRDLGAHHLKFALVKEAAREFELRLAQHDALAGIDVHVDGRDLAFTVAHGLDGNTRAVVPEGLDGVAHGAREAPSDRVRIVVLSEHQMRAHVFLHFRGEPNEMNGNVGGRKGRGQRDQDPEGRKGGESFQGQGTSKGKNIGFSEV